jgi:catalase
MLSTGWGGDGVARPASATRPSEGAPVVTPRQAIATVDQLFGRHPGYRALHAKGTLCRATFRATPEASRLTTASHMQGDPVDALVRFSNASGPPASRDDATTPRGMAVTFCLEDGRRTDVVALTAPRFPTRTADGFTELLLALRPGVTRPARLFGYLVRHPGAMRAVGDLLAASKPPPSYAACTYHALHAFRWVAADGSTCHVRYRWEPQTPVASTSRREGRRRHPDCLQQDLAERLRRGTIRFTLVLQVAGDGDRVDDVTAVWPSDRETIAAGTLEVTGVEAPPGAYSDRLVFDPTRLTDGIQGTADPVLWFRPPVYALSAERRGVRTANAGRCRSDPGVREQEREREREREKEKQKERTG